MELVLHDGSSESCDSTLALPRTLMTLMRSRTRIVRLGKESVTVVSAIQRRCVLCCSS